MTYGSGIFILTRSFSAERLTKLLSYASTVVSKKLYLRLPRSDYVNPNICRWKNLISVCYSTASLVCPSVRVCLLLPRLPNFDEICSRHFEVVMTDINDPDASSILNTAKTLGDISEASLLQNNLGDLFSVDDDRTLYVEDISTAKFKSVCLGGTFDHLHNGHRILLSIAALLAEQRLCVGITDACLLGEKLLSPLIQAYDIRVSAVAEFLIDIDFPRTLTEFCCLKDPLGPPIHDPDFDCIIASPESIPGCRKINDVRAKNTLPSLCIEEIQFVEQLDIHVVPKMSFPPDLIEKKLSSSTCRLNLLGRLLQPVSSNLSERRPYIIGLVGPAGSGKSSISRHLVDIAGDQIHILPVDQMAHDVYRPGTEIYSKLIEHFSPDTIICKEPPHFIDRKALGRLVFNSPDKLTALNNIVWPSVADSIKQRISTIRESTLSSLLVPVVLIDAALLFDAGWDSICHEIWATYVPRDTSERRIASRDLLTAEEARRRIDFQSAGIKQVVGNQNIDWWSPCQLGASFGPISRCNVVFCSQWDVNFTRNQVDLAWTDLMTRISNASV